jgi:MoxR-like ATPase
MSESDSPLSPGDAAPDLPSAIAGLHRARAALAAIVIGQETVIDRLLITLLADAHALLVGLPGLAKSLLVQSTAAVLGLDSRRIQFTPDLMPADILGSEVLDQDSSGSRRFRFVQGPVFCQLLMADEINRAPPRTQSALLQAMQERHVAVAGTNRPLPRPFHVIATQNPLEQEGTYPLPEAQLDRFLLQIPVDYPDAAAERRILIETTQGSRPAPSPAMSLADLATLQAAVKDMPTPAHLVDIIVDVVRALRPGSEGIAADIAWGPSPRAAQALLLAARGAALLDGRTTPVLGDVESVAVCALGHRMALTYDAAARGLTVQALIADVLRRHFS